MGIRWGQSDVDRAMRKAPRAKYGAKRIQIDGIWFDSKAEGARYSALKMMQTAGLINWIECHPAFPIGIKGIFICDVVLDFRYYDVKRDTIVYEDVKGKDNPLSALKRKLVEAEYSIVVEVVK